MTTISDFMGYGSRYPFLKIPDFIRLKSMAAYAYHALMLGASDETVNRFFLSGLCEIAKDGTIESLLPTVLKLGEVNSSCMAMLDAANTERMELRRLSVFRLWWKKDRLSL